VARETLYTGGKVLTDIAEYDDMSSGDIVSKHVTECDQNLIKKFRGLGRKRSREAAVGGKKLLRRPKPRKMERAPR